MTITAIIILGILVDGYNLSGVSYDQFVGECERVEHHYKEWFDQ